MQAEQKHSLEINTSTASTPSEHSAMTEASASTEPPPPGYGMATIFFPNLYLPPAFQSSAEKEAMREEAERLWQTVKPLEATPFSPSTGNLLLPPCFPFQC